MHGAPSGLVAVRARIFAFWSFCLGLFLCLKHSLLALRLSSLPLHLRSLNPWQRNPQPGLGHSGAFPFTRWSFPPQLPGVPSSPTQCSSFPSSRSFSSKRPERLLLVVVQPTVVAALAGVRVSPALCSQSLLLVAPRVFLLPLAQAYGDAL